MPTKLYFHDVANDLAGTFPASALGQTPNWTVAGAQTLKKMNLTIGTGQVQKTGTSIATITAQWCLLGRFVTPELAAGSIGGSTLTSVVNFAALETNLSMDFCEDVRLDMIVWRPSTGTNLGTLVTSASTYTGDVEPLSANSERVIQARRTGVPSPITLQDGDVLMVEIWSRHIQAAANAYDGSFYFDGTTENLTANSVVTDHAGFLELTYTLNFLTATTVSGSAAFTLGAATLAATGTVDITASSAPTLAAVTLAATGNVNVTASAAFTLAALTLSSVIGEAVTASAAFTLGNVTLVAAGNVNVTASAAATLANATLAAAGNVNVTASTAATLAAVTLASTLTFAAASVTASVVTTDPGAGSGAAASAYAPRRVFQIPQQEPKEFTLDDIYPPANPVQMPPAAPMVDQIVYAPLTMATGIYFPQAAPPALPAAPRLELPDDEDDFYELAGVLSLLL